MDLQQSANYHRHHHHLQPPPPPQLSRYVPIHNSQSRLPSNPPPSVYHQPYHHHNHQHHLPPPPPRSFLPPPIPPPPPSSYNHSQFTFPNSPTPVRHSFVNLPQRDFNRVDSRFDHRNRFDLEQDKCYSSIRGFTSFREEFAGGYRFKEELNNNHRVVESREEDRIRGYLATADNFGDSLTSSRGLGFGKDGKFRDVPSNSRDLGFENSDKFRDMFSVSRGLDSENDLFSLKEDNARWEFYRHQQERSRGANAIDSLGGFRMSDYDLDDDDERMLPRKRVARSRGNERTPPRQVQKKSAFLRIQMGKPGYRIREDRDEMKFQSSGCVDESISSPYKGKYSAAEKDQKVEEGGEGRELKEGSSVELDVSFKSNSLVAKAITTTPTSSAVNSTRKNKRIRKLIMPDTKESSSPKSNRSADSVKLEENEAATGSGKADDTPVKQPCSGGTVTPLGKRMAVRSPVDKVSAKVVRSSGDKVSAKVVRSSGDKVSVKGSEDSSAAKSSPRVTKRKKIIKKVPASVPSMLISQPSVVELDQFKKTSSATSNPDKEITPSKPSVPVQCEFLNISPRNIVSSEVCADVDSCNRCSFSTLEADCTLILDPSTCQDENDYGGFVDADRINNDLVIIPDLDSRLTPQNCSSLDNGGVDNTIKQSLQSGMGINEGYNHSLSCLTESKIVDGAAVNHSSGLGGNCALSSDSNVSRLQVATSSSINATDGDGKQPFPNEVNSLLGHFERVENNASSGENIVQQRSLSSEVHLNGSNLSVSGGTESCRCSRAISMENGPIHGCSSSSNEAITLLDRECKPNIKNKRKERSPLVDTLVNKMEQENVTSIDSGNAKLKNLAEDDSHANVDNVFCSRILDVHSQSTCEDVGVFEKASLDGLPDNVLYTRDEENGFCISPSSKLPKNEKKRKLLAEHSSVALDGDLSLSDADRCPIIHKSVAEPDEIPESIICNVGNASFSPSLEQRFLFCGNSVAENKLIASAVLSPSSLDQEDLQIRNSIQMTIAGHQLDMESVNEDDVDICTIEEDIVKVNGFPLNLQTSCSNQTLSDLVNVHEHMLSDKENLPSVSSFDFLSSPCEGFTINDESMESDPDTLSVVGSPVSVEPNTIKSSLGPSYAYDGREEKSVDGMDLDNDLQLGKSSSADAVKVPTPQTITKRMSHNQKSLSLTAKFLPKHPSYSVPRSYYGHSSVVFNKSKNTAATAHITKSRTWHKSTNPSSSLLLGNKSAVPLAKPMQNQNENVDNASYIRRGNSLVRKPSAPSVPARGSHDSTSIVSAKVENRNRGSGNTVDLAEPPTSARKLKIIASLYTPQISKLLPGVRSSDCIVSSSVSRACSPSDEPNCSGTMSDPMICTEDKGVLDSSLCTMECSGMPVSENVKSSEVQSSSNDGNAMSSKRSTITNVKHKSNQLIASTRQSNSVQKRTEKSNSDGYYKKKKNQLIRMPLEVDKNDSVPDEILKSEVQTSCKFPTVRQPGKGLCKPSKFSLVWKLGGTQPSKDITSSLQRHVLPSRVPWKKTNWKYFMQNSSMTSCSSISRRLSLLRRRDTLYTRSTHGLSLWKSKVLSVGGSSLKWSKSIEMRSKKVSEEATTAVAAAEREKREQSDLNYVKSAARSRNQSSRKCTKSTKLHPGGRIFRIGSFRYRMDSSKKTLRRIPDQPLHPDALQDKDARKTYVPRRLVIGNEQYVRIGNGNQLVRDPKKRARMLASEKVRWSLHTARLRLARKQKYCQFFTRFGKCNKNDGKCPYIHDPSKVSVCTKFLKGLCSNPDCKLTHKVIPERMPDCSFFLLGLCSNENCPYRHVNVSPNASACEGFLKGYCAQGNECRNKHSYVCPVFEATGTCAQGCKCKFHHPKKSNGKKKKLSREEKNGQGRYFGSPQIDVVDSRIAVSVKLSTMVNEDASLDGEAPDFISLDVSDADAEETTNWVRSDECQIKAMGLEEDDLDELIRPIRLLKRNLTSS